MRGNVLVIPYYKDIKADEKEINMLFERCPANHIGQISWKDYPYKPEVTFKIAYSDQAIVLKFEVNERYIRINTFQTNGPVWEDSCVEFFISFQNSSYYNLEFNALGIALVGYSSSDRSLKKRLPDDIVEKIKSFSTIKSPIDKEGVNWCLTLYIPLEVFKFETFQSLKGLSCKANFYKCGDLLPQPHYLSWLPISSPEPNFHLPEFFGKIKFDDK
ncbi:carbohydrate-binding family 9-like protein [Albibacterium bauzanense]|uniref:Cellulose/xylan binding protein with CBM9 domain n=1 Tax=Albibacterium bauzanense TaxID=653929 RepID=A0A4R1LZT6_9SPHI|nr:carbohydrate-binding family 9-like protein [Albibacterium bauzanense]TCK84855.1 cellulose/xylan binding protein with CBM9 domain [Albibacterium bauzanense]